MPVPHRLYRRTDYFIQEWEVVPELDNLSAEKPRLIIIFLLYKLILMGLNLSLLGNVNKHCVTLTIHLLSL